MDIVLYSFFAFLFFFLFVGLMSARRRRRSPEDYLLASREVSPAFSGLSAAASTASGFGFTGMIAFGFLNGLSGAWFIFGLIFGSLLGFALVSRRFRTYSQREGASSYSEFLSHGVSGNRRRIQFVIGAVSIFAVILYATAQLTAGSKALHVLFDWDYNVGAILGAMIVLMYCLAGGIRASIWTDVAQIIVMFGSMFILAVVALVELGGFSGLFATLRSIDPELVHILPRDNPFGPLLFIFGWMAVGFAFVGFPHVMIRFMALDKPRQTRNAIIWFELSYGSFYILAYIVALCARALLPEAGIPDRELMLPELAGQLLPEIMLGLILAGIFAGTISTADSLVLSCSASLSRDIFHKYRDSYQFLKVSTFAVTLLALIMALSGSKSVFDMVLFAITIMGAGFVPLIVVRVMRWPLSEFSALLMIALGIAAGVWWRLEGYHAHVNDALPGIITGMAVYTVYALYRLYRRPAAGREAVPAGVKAHETQ